MRRRVSRAALFLGILFAFLLPLASSAPATPWTPSANAVGDARCTVEDVQFANEKELHELLGELADTTYMRLFPVDLNRPCKFWGKDAGAGAEEETPSCAAGDASDADEEPASAAFSHSSSSSFAGDRAVSLAPSLEPSAAPSCSLTPPSPIDNPRLGERQSATTPVDRTISPREDAALASASAPEEDCEEDESSPTFWLDMCRAQDAQETHATEHVNLKRNPERWTGYNGSHVWRAIYDENCLRNGRRDGRREVMGGGGDAIVGGASESESTGIDGLCYEERVLYRLLSGMHASVNVHVALRAKPPKRAAGIAEWSEDPERYARHYGEHPERLRNLHFSFVVLLRALRKAAPALLDVDVKLGEDAVEDARTEALMRRLLDTHILSSCAGVFDAFDESELFRASISSTSDASAASLKTQFKGVWHNISDVMDCISCQKCKLHGKLQLLGLGTALKVLLLPEHLHRGALSRSEVVALVNTAAKFSHAILKAPELEKLAREAAAAREEAAAATTTTTTAGKTERSADASDDDPPGGSDETTTRKLMNAAVRAAAAAARDGDATEEEEDAVIAAALASDARVLTLARHYARDTPGKFVKHALRALATPAAAAATTEKTPTATKRERIVDAVVVGGGLAGLSAALTILDRGGVVVLLEKEGYVGGNSQWASSGINGVDRVNYPENPDTVETYAEDCYKHSRGDNGNGNALAPESVEHVPALTRGSVETLEWFRARVGVDLSKVGRLGGHSHARTHRPASGMAGSTLVSGVQKKCDEYRSSGAFTVMKRHRATEITTDARTGAVDGVRWVAPLDGVVGANETAGWTRARNVILATGGYAGDREGLLREHAPFATRFATTNTPGSVGDGHKMAMKLGASAIDLQNVQIHPTGFVDASDVDAGTKTLAAEILRGAGGVLLTRGGVRFVDELGGRDYVTNTMIAEAEAEEAAGGLAANGGGVALNFVILLDAVAAAEADKHVPMYVKKNLLARRDTMEDVANWMDATLRARDVKRRPFGKPTRDVVTDAIRAHDDAAASGEPCPLTNKTAFRASGRFDLRGPFYAGRVTPVVHYTMGGIRVDDAMRVVRARDDGGVEPVDGLFAVGEMTGGTHGRNRLGGNALTECAVFGRAAGRAAMIVRDGETTTTTTTAAAAAADATAATRGGKEGFTLQITRDELAKHASSDDCWVAIGGDVYDFTDFLDDHPAGAEAILKLGGTDGTEAFDAVHGRDMLEAFEAVGVLAE
jgi:flavocytochrome c